MVQKLKRQRNVPCLNMGFWNYLTKVGIPSVTGYLLGDNLPYDYYTAPWEAEADKYGGVNPATRPVEKGPWTEQHGYYDINNLISAFLSDKGAYIEKIIKFCPYYNYSYFYMYY